MKVDWYYLIVTAVVGALCVYLVMTPRRKKGLPWGTTGKWPRLSSNKDPRRDSSNEQG